MLIEANETKSRSGDGLFVGYPSTVAAAVLAIVFVRLIVLGAYPLFDNTEARYALVGRLMYETGDWIIPQIEPGQPFWAKPPLSIWGTAASYAVFGISEFAARFPSFLIFVAASLLIVAAPPPRAERALGWLAVLIFLSTGLGFYLSGAVMTDASLMLGVAITMVAFWKRMNGGSVAWAYGFFLGIAFCALAKGLVGIVLCGLGIGAWVAWHGKWRATWRDFPWFVGTLLALALALPWYLIVEARTPGFLYYFIIGEHFDRYLIHDWPGDLYGKPRTQPFGMIWIFALAGTLPWSLVLAAIVLIPRWRRQAFGPGILRDEWHSYMLSWLLSTLVFFTPAQAVLPAYVVMSLPPFAWMTAVALRDAGLDCKPSVLAIGALIPVVFLILLCGIWTFPTSRFVPAQISIVVASTSQPGKHDLIYFLDRPYSAEFYSNGRAKLALDVPTLEKFFEDPHSHIAITRSCLEFLPADAREKLVEIAEMNETILYRPRAALVVDPENPKRRPSPPVAGPVAAPNPDGFEGCRRSRAVWSGTDGLATKP